jgi:predicted porin
MQTKMLFAATLAAVGAAAHAQSRVTLYGLIDPGLTYVNNSNKGTGGASKSFIGTNDKIHGSRWGQRGSEDLGGGLKAIFKLESGFFPTSTS